MTFFDKKEEVLEIKLTSYGRQKLASGKFKPVYYAFFDDDILYDADRAGVTEDNNDIEPRIQENTPSTRIQTGFTDLEKKVMKQTHVFSNGIFHEHDVTDLNFDPDVFADTDGLRNVLPLGHSQLGNQHAASWRVEFLDGEFYASKSNLNDDPNKKTIVNIPQIDCDIDVQPVLVEKTFTGVADEETGRYVAVNPETNQFIRLTEDSILLDISEGNVDILNDAYSLEVFEVVTEDSKEVLKPKMFLREVEHIKNGILLDKQEIDAQIRQYQTNNKIVEYFFDISFDDNIDERTKFHKIVSREFKGNLFDNNVGFESFSQTPGSRLYTTDNEGEDC